MLIRRSALTVIYGTIIGGLIGTIIGEILWRIVPQGAVRDLFLKPLNFGFSPFTLDLAIFQFTLGFIMHFHLMTVFFIFLTIYLLLKF